MPVFILRSSMLGTELIESVLGRGILDAAVPADSAMPLHPLAIAGFAGMMANALALIPIGSKFCAGCVDCRTNALSERPLSFLATRPPPDTDGGRISLSMFGRRGAYITSCFSCLALCLVGLFGMDEARILLTYALLCAVWQRDLEAPVANEVAELDVARGFMGISSWVIAILTLFPCM